MRIDLRKVYSNVYFCALNRWAHLSTSPKLEDRARAKSEKLTAMMAISLCCPRVKKNENS